VARLSIDYGWPGTFLALSVVALLTCLGAPVYYFMQRKAVPAGR
jgi:hypothetical protein